MAQNDLRILPGPPAAPARASDGRASSTPSGPVTLREATAHSVEVHASSRAPATTVATPMDPQAAIDAELAFLRSLDSGGSAKGPPIDHAFWQRMGLDPDDSGLDQPFHNHPWVHRVFRILAENFLQARFIVDDARREGLNPLPNHPITKLFRRPNPGMSPDVFWSLSLLFLLMKGEVFWIVDRDLPSSMWTALWPWQGGEHWEIADEDANKVPTAWQLTDADGKRQVFQSWEIVQFKFPDPNNPRRGISPLVAADTFIDTDILAGRFNLEFFRNGAQPGGAIETKGQLSAAERRAMWKHWDDKHRGVAKSWRPAMFWGGAKWVQTGLTHEDMLFLEQFKWNRDGIAAMFGVPKLLLNATDALPRNLAFVEMERFWKNTMLPLLRLFEMTIDAQLFMTVDKGQVRPAFDTTHIEALQGDLTAKVETAERLWGMGVPFTEVNQRMRLGFRNRFKGDDVPWVPVGVLPAAIQVAGPATPPTQAALLAPETVALLDVTELAKLPGTPEADDEHADENAAAFAAEVLSLPEPEQRQAQNDAQWWEGYNAQVLAPSEARLMRVFSPFFRALGTAQLEKFDRFVAGELALPTDAISTKVITEEDLAAILFDADEWKAILEPAYRESITQIGRIATAFNTAEFTAMVGPQAVFDLMSEPVLAFMDARVANVTRVVDTVHQRMSRSLLKGIQAGETNQQLRARLEQIDSSLKSRERSAVIARTESGVVANTIRFQHMAQAGITHHRWVTARDEKVRDSHRRAERESRRNPVRVGEPFSNGLIHPNDPGAPIAEIAQCRCSARGIAPKPRPRSAPATKQGRTLVKALGGAPQLADAGGESA